MDFLHCLDPDTSVKILMRLEDLSDIVRASSVSRLWRHFVVVNGLSKHLCLRMHPELSRVKCVTEANSITKSHLGAGSTNSVEQDELEKEHRVYTFLARAHMLFPVRRCMLKPICASSTDNFPEESIENTLEPGDRVAHQASYWSSKGQSNPTVPETLTYKLDADLCVITEIDIQPFKAYFERGLPIYSAKSVRFRMGHSTSPFNDLVDESRLPKHELFVWTYTSQEFPMAQENCLQKFKLPEPVLCIGGILRIELLGRVQREEMDGLFYICVSHVRVVGRPLSSAFDTEILEPSGKFVLKALSYEQPPTLEVTGVISNLQRSVTRLEQLLNILRGNAVENGVDDVEYVSEDEDSELEDEFYH